MATITAGTGATINATTIEGQLWQLIHYIQSAELTETTSTDRVQSSKDDSFVMTGSFTIPGSFAYSSSTGSFSLSAAPYMPAIPFTAGSTPGTIKGATLTQYFIDVISYLVAWQNNPLKNTQALSRISLTFNYSKQEYSGSFSLPFTSTIGTLGSVTEQATEWLLT